MRYFSGFCFKNEQKLFKKILLENDFCIAGFSYGAIKAFEFALSSKTRVETIQLISPAFFQDKNERFISVQLKAFEKNREKYLVNFYKNAAYPLKIDIKKYQTLGEIDQLQELLNYKWDIKKVKKLKERGISIEVFLGKYDKIIDAKIVKEFFYPFATIYWYNNLGHIITGV